MLQILVELLGRRSLYEEQTDGDDDASTKKEAQVRK